VFLVQFLLNILSKITRYATAPLIFHAQQGGSIVIFCESLIEFVDANGLLILSMIFIISLLLFKNTIFQISNFGTGSTLKNLSSNSNQLKAQSFRNTFSYLNTSFIKRINLFLKK